MFTGLIEKKVHLMESQSIGFGMRMAFEMGEDSAQIAIGDSIALNGCCLTAVQIDKTRCWFELGSETLARTNLGSLRVGDAVNYERSLRVGDRMGGHFVTGHIDGPGKIRERRNEGEWSFFEVETGLPLLRQIASKGSIAIDGVSLTVVDATDTFFSVALIPHTLEKTTLGSLQVGDHVNLETDLLAKYISRGQVHFAG